MIEKFFDNKTGIILISIIWGFGLAMIFSKACIGRNCITIRGPNPNLLKDRVYNFDKQCYTFTPYVSKCGDDKPIKTTNIASREPNSLKH
jgi:hypothetical protein